MKRKILHFSFDYSKENIGKSTVAVSDLINETAQFSEPLIISLSRSLNPFDEQIILDSKHSVYFTAFGLPYGLFLSTNMKRMFKKLINSSASKIILNNDISFVHSHKLTYEGFIGYQFAKKISKPLFISLRQTDFQVLRYRPDLKKICRRILAYSSIIFYIAPYMKELLKDFLSEGFYFEHVMSKLIYLPNSVNTNRFNLHEEKINDRFLTILWLNKKPIKRKNLYRLFQAIGKLKGSGIFLDVIGHGDYDYEVKRWTEKLSIENQVKFLGFVNNNEIPKYLGKYKGFLMPSHSETFGMAYVESLLCGTPILYTKGTGFDGVFEGVGVAVNSKSVESIVEGIKNISVNSQLYRKNIQKLRYVGAFDIFSRESVREVYKEFLNKVVS